MTRQLAPWATSREIALAAALDAEDFAMQGAIGYTPYVHGTLARPADATQYSVGDIIANSGTGSAVVPITFNVARVTNGTGRISGCRCGVKAASSTVVLPAFDLLLFRPVTDLPFAAGSYPADNAALNVSADAMAQLLCTFAFAAGSWRNQAGAASAAGTGIWQDAALPARAYAPFNLADTGSLAVLGLLQAQNTWNPGAIVNTFSFVLDVDQD